MLITDTASKSFCTFRKPEMSRDMTKPTKWLCAQRRLRSAWASTKSYQSLRCALNGKLRTQAFFMRTANSDQTWWMPRLIWVFAKQSVGFVMSRLKYSLHDDPKFQNGQVFAKKCIPRSDSSSRSAIWSGDTLFAIPSASFGHIIRR